MTRFRLSSELWLAAPRDEVFPFFAEAANLERLTPPFLRFAIVTPAPIEMRRGARIDYRLRVRGLPLRWRTEITAWEPPLRFEDTQLKGPYREWVHEHRFEEVDGGTRCLDTVRFRAPGPALLTEWLVVPDVVRIFRYRHDALRARFGGREEERKARVDVVRED